MNVTVIGGGYVGLVTAACLAEAGHHVTVAERDGEKVQAIRAARSYLHEPDLEPLLVRHAGGRLMATTDTAAAVAGAHVVLLCVPTPCQPSTGQIDLSYLKQAAREVGEALQQSTEAYPVVVVKSTCVPGTTDAVVGPALEAAAGRTRGQDLGLGCNPEFLSEGSAVEDFSRPDRIVLGADCQRTHAVLRELYAAWADVPRFAVNNATAEAIKYASNALLATCISFANEVADVCQAAGGIDAVDVMHGLHASRYLDAGGAPAGIAAFLMPGCGYGGSCLPKDVAALTAFGKERGLRMPLLSAVTRVNQERARAMVDLLRTETGSLAGRRVAVLGVAFKPGTADCRNTPAEPLVQALVAAGASVVCHDPAAWREARTLFGEIADVAPYLAAALDGATAAVICTAWPQYQQVPDLLRAAGGMTVLLDGRRMLEADAYERLLCVGYRPFTYEEVAV